MQGSEFPWSILPIIIYLTMANVGWPRPLTAYTPTASLSVGYLSVLVNLPSQPCFMYEDSVSAFSAFAMIITPSTLIVIKHIQLCSTTARLHKPYALPGQQWMFWSFIFTGDMSLPSIHFAEVEM